MAGCLGRQVSPSCPTGGEERTLRHPRGPREQGGLYKIKTCKFLSYPPAWVTPAFLPRAFGFHTCFDFNRLGMLQTN